MKLKLTLKKDYTIPQNVKTRIKELNTMFFDNDFEYRHNKTLPIKIQQELNVLYRKYIASKYENLGWGYDFIKIEKREAGKTKSKNETSFIQLYLLNWITNFGKKLDIFGAFHNLTSREVYRIMLSTSYE